MSARVVPGEALRIGRRAITRFFARPLQRRVRGGTVESMRTASVLRDPGDAPHDLALLHEFFARIASLAAMAARCVAVRYRLRQRDEHARRQLFK